jgi:hypothetical protein
VFWYNRIRRRVEQSSIDIWNLEKKKMSLSLVQRCPGMSLSGSDHKERNNIYNVWKTSQRCSLILLVSENVKDFFRSVLMFVIVLSRTARLCTVFWYNRIRRPPMYWRPQISTEHHVSNLRAYIANNITPKGLHIKLTPQSTGWKSNRFLERWDFQQVLDLLMTNWRLCHFGLY